jgi:hypothetical protein
VLDLSRDLDGSPDPWPNPNPDQLQRPTEADFEKSSNAIVAARRSAFGVRRSAFGVRRFSLLHGGDVWAPWALLPDGTRLRQAYAAAGSIGLMGLIRKGP